MKSYIKNILLLFFICGSFHGFAQELQFNEEEKQWIAEHPIIEFGYDQRWEPYEIFTSGQYGGIISEYLKIIELKTGIDMRPIPDMNWEKSIKGLKDGSLMVIPSCVSTPVRKELFELSNPYIQDPIVIVALKDAAYFSTLADLKGKTISLSENYYTVELIKNQFPEINIKEYQTIEKCFTALIDGESDAFVGKLNVITYYINHYGFDNIRIVGTTPFQDHGICFAMNPEWTIFKGIVNKIIAQTTPEQQHQIRERWIASEEGKKYSTAFYTWVFIIFIAVLVILIIVYYWNRVLKKKLDLKRKTEVRLNELLFEVQKSDEEKKVLLQEIHHRVKNNLQIVSSMLNLQANTTHDEKTRNALKDAMDRVASIALVHKKMYQSPQMQTVELKSYTESLYKSVCTQYPDCENVEIEINAVDVVSTMDSLIPLGLILNELITNSLKYAFHSQNYPKITINFSTENHNRTLKMEYADNGTWIKNEESDQFGTSMIEIFTEQLEGSFDIQKEVNSTAYIFNFKGVEIK